MIKDDKSFIKDNKERLLRIFGDMHKGAQKKVFYLPQGVERDIQIEFVKFLENWLYNIEIFSKPEIQENKDDI